MYLVIQPVDCIIDAEQPDKVVPAVRQFNQGI